MVRLVFRPYAQVARSICTSEPLRASTGVSPGFALPKRRSPSFGSRRARSYSAPPIRAGRGTGRRCSPATEASGDLAADGTGPALAFTSPAGFVEALRLARTPDSLVRVSRRVGWTTVRSPTTCCGARGRAVDAPEPTPDESDARRGLAADATPPDPAALLLGPLPAPFRRARLGPRERDLPTDRRREGESPSRLRPREVDPAGTRPETDGGP